jgi:hypothetical protein
MEVDKIGIHATHCCSKCLSCKYGDDEDCPVVNGTVDGLYPCESCEGDEEHVVYYMTHLNTSDFSDIIEKIQNMRNNND